MKTKRIACLAACVVIAGSVVTEMSASEKREWRATVTVVGETGEPIAGADAEMSWNVNRPDLSTTFDETHGSTDTNGVFRTSHEANGSIDLGFSASKVGYYAARKGYALAQLSDSDPAKWNPSVTLLLKRVVEPVPMYAKRVMEMPPAKDIAVAYDLQIGDWIVPYGKGLHADILFTSHFTKRAENDWDYKLTVAFPNPGDGIQPFVISDLEKTSVLRSPREAAEDGYKPEWVKTQSQRPGGYTRYGINENLNFFFRVRTVLDEHGQVRSANYGKTYGDFMNFRYYFNPTPNDRNVEFDPKRNLLTGLKSFEQVTAP